MTLLDLRTLVSRWVDDPNNGYFSVADVNSYLNSAQQEVQKLLIQAFEDKYIKVVQTAAVVNQIEYQVPVDFKKLNRFDVIVSGTTVNNEDRRRISKITRNQQDDLVNLQSAIPCYYYFNNDNIVIMPPPDQSYILRLSYTYKVSDMILDTDVPDIPTEYQEFIAILATITCLTRDTRDASQYIEKRTYYEKQLKRDAEQRNIDEPRTVVQTLDDGDTDGLGYF